MASLWTNKGVAMVMSGIIDLDTTTNIKAMLLKSTFTPAKTDNFVSDIVASECNATNYTGGFGGAGRKAIGGRSITEEPSANDRAMFDGNDPATWTTLGGATNNTLRSVAIIHEITNDAASEVILYNDMGADQNTNGSDFTTAFAAPPGGIGYIAT